MEVVTAVLPTILECVVAPIKRHLSYAFSFRSKVNKLGGEVQKLKVEQENLEHSVGDKLRQGEEIMDDVKKWQNEVEKAIEEAEELIEHGQEEAQKSCSARLCLNLKKRYDVGKKAEDKTSGVIQLQEEKSRFVSISYLPRLQQIVKPPVEGYEAESRKKILKEVMEAVMDSNVNIVGVYGLGGIGKTTLAKEIHRQAKRDKLFEDVILATVTATPELRRVQGEIADMLDLKLDKETEHGRASRLYQRLNGRNILIILDDLWNMLDLEKVGIPTGNDSNGCKVLLTSRKLDVLYEMHSQKNFQLQDLSKEEARNLFEIKVADVKDSETEEKILLKCAGFPLLIVTVAGLLKNKDLHVWKDTMTQLWMFEDGEIPKKVHSFLGLSYDYLPDDETKLIFLLCGICGESDTTILDLLKYSLGLGLFKRYTVEEARNRLNTLMDHLKSSSLLLDINYEGLVRMHDTVRDFAISKALRDQRVFRVKYAEERLRVWPSRDDLKNCNKISLPYCDIRQLPADLGCPEAEFFLFSSSDDSLDISDSAFQGMELLKVLSFREMCFSPVPKSFCFLTNLHTLCLDGCQLSDMAIIGQLKKLEILSFRGSNLELLPSEIGQLTRLKLLDLSDCSRLTVVPANVISKLFSLEELLMRNSFHEWEMEEHSNSRNASLSELESLSRLSSLEIHVPNAEALPMKLFSKHLERYQILIGDVSSWDEDYKRSKTLKLKLDTDIHVLDRVKILLKETETLCIEYMSRPMNELPNLGIGGFCKLRELRVKNCNMLKNIFKLSMVRSLSQLETMEVSRCDGMEGIVVDEGDCGFDGNEVVEFPRLRYLTLSNLPQLKGFVYKKKSSPISEAIVPWYSKTASDYELGTPLPLFDKMVAFPCLEELQVSSIHNIETIWSNQIAEGSLRKLMSLKICSCNELQTVFPSCILGRFQKLKSLAVWECELLEEIYQFQDLNVEIPNERTLMTFELKDFSLFNLPKLKNIWRSTTGRFFTFQNLESIQVGRCEALKYIFPPFIAKSLPQLKTLCVWLCGVMEEMVAKEESGNNNNIPYLLFPQLSFLDLSGLKEMRSFYPGRHTLGCPKLKFLTVRGCHKATMLISETRGEGQHDDNIIPHDQQPFFLVKKVFPNLEEMLIDNIFFKALLHSLSTIQYLTRLRSLVLSGFQGKFMTISLFRVFESIPSNLRELEVSYSYLKELHKYRRVGNDKIDFATSPLPHIKILKLFYIKSLKYVRRQDSQMDLVFQHLETLKLRDCEDLICLAPSSYASFQNLTSLEIWRCNQMINLINPSTAKTMANLVKLHIEECSALKEIVAADDGQDDGDNATNIEDIVFNKLETLKFEDLENLMGFCMSSRYFFHFPCLEEVSIERCPNLRIFCHGVLDTPKLNCFKVNGLWKDDDDLNATTKQGYEEMIGLQQLQKLRLSWIPQLIERWHGQLSFEFFHSLLELMVDKCALFSSAIPSNLLPFLNNLRELVVEQCDSVEEVFDLDGLNVSKGHVDLLSELSRLKLIQLPKLRHIWNEDPLGILGIRNLTKLKVYCCGRLTSIFTLSIVVGLVNLQSLEVKECNLVKAIIKKKEEEEVEWDHKTMFPSLKSIELEHLPGLLNFYSGGHVLTCLSLKEVKVVGCPQMLVHGCNISSRGIAERHEERPPEGSLGDMPTLRLFNSQVEILSLEKLVVEWNSAVNEIWHALFSAPFLRTLGVIQLIGFPAELALLPSGFLHSLPNLKTFVVDDSSSKRIFPKEVNTVKEIQPAGPFVQLEILKLFNLPNLEHLVEDYSQLGSLFQHLKELQVIKCNGLARLLTSSTAKGLLNLQIMVVKECERITEIVASDSNEVETDIGFDQLEYLELHGLPCLTSFSSNCTFNFPRLEKVIIRKCPKMTIFAQNGLSAPWLDEVQIGEDEDVGRWEDSLNSTIEKLFLEKDVQDVKKDEVALSCT